MPHARDAVTRVPAGPRGSVALRVHASRGCWRRRPEIGRCARCAFGLTLAGPNAHLARCAMGGGSPWWPDAPGFLRGKREEPAPEGRLFSDVMCGGVLLSREASLAVPSALRGLTSGFGMGPGVSPSLWPPQLYGNIGLRDGSRPYSGNRTVNASAKVIGVSQALGLLVPVS